MLIADIKQNKDGQWYAKIWNVKTGEHIRKTNPTSDEEALKRALIKVWGNIKIRRV